MKVQIFIPCFIDQFYPHTAFNMVKVLEKACCDVYYNNNQTCCGQAAYNAGYVNDAKDVCLKWINDFDTTDYIVCPSASCVGFIKNYYPKIFDNTAIHNKVKEISKRTIEFSTFLTDIIHIDNFGARLNVKATYHDSCAALRECKIKDSPRKLLANVKDLTLVEMAETETCCGFGGSFAIKFDAISVAMADQKINHAIATGASHIISTDISCLMHLQGCIEKKGLPLTTSHIADVLASGWDT